MTFVGFDLSTKRIAAVAFDQETSNAMTWLYEINGPRDTFEPGVLDRAYMAAAEVMSDLAKIGTKRNGAVPFIEAPLHGKGQKTTIVQSMVSGVVQLAMVQSGHRPQMVNVSTWKKTVIGNGNATKDDIASFIKQRWRPIFDEAAGNQDILDAAGVCLYGLVTRSGKPNVEAPRKMRKRR